LTFFAIFEKPYESWKITTCPLAQPTVKGRKGFMQKGICPKCGSTEVYMRESALNIDGSSLTLTTSLFGKAFALDCYVCLDCRYVEMYAAENSSTLIGKRKSLGKAIRQSSKWRLV
jgi:predicted nucleic-acid-binding Zn-ribbon protein